MYIRLNPDRLSDTSKFAFGEDKVEQLKNTSVITTPGSTKISVANAPAGSMIMIQLVKPNDKVYQYSHIFEESVGNTPSVIDLDTIGELIDSEDESGIAVKGYAWVEMGNPSETTVFPSTDAQELSFNYACPRLTNVSYDEELTSEVPGTISATVVSNKIDSSNSEKKTDNGQNIGEAEPFQEKINSIDGKEKSENVKDSNESVQDRDENGSSTTPEIIASSVEAATEEVSKLIKKILNGEKIEGMSKKLIEKIQTAIEDGKNITIEVTASKIDESQVNDDAEKVKYEISDGKVVLAYYSIDVNVLIEGNLAGNVTKLGDKIMITLDLPTDLPTVPEGYTRIFKVIKVHDGVATEIDTTVNGSKFSFNSDEFSTFALTYEDIKNEKLEIKNDDSENVTKNISAKAIKKNNLKTGDINSIVLIGMHELLALFSAAYLIIRKKKFNQF